jgi:hypothetical protein
MPAGQLQSTCDNCGKQFWNPAMYICNPDAGDGDIAGCGAILCSDCYRRSARENTAGATCARCGAPARVLIPVDMYMRREWNEREEPSAVGL